jgi:hypothetical protein
MEMTIRNSRQVMAEALDQRVFAVVGASRDTSKFGYRIYRFLLDAGYTAYAVNPNADTIDGEQVYPLLDNVPEQIDVIVTVVPPDVAWDVVRRASHSGARYLWMQPGSESERAIKDARANGLEVVAGGPCIMVEIEQRRMDAGHEDDGPAI